MKLEDLNASDAFDLADTSETGLSSSQAAARLESQLLPNRDRDSDLRLFLRQFKSPLVLLLIVALIISVSIGEHLDAGIVFSVIAMSTFLGFWQERRASKALEELLAIIQSESMVLRDGLKVKIPSAQVVPGDILLLCAGDTIPGDGILIASKDLFVDESSLTGESFPAEKHALTSSKRPESKSAEGIVRDGTHVVSGTARVVIMKTGTETQFGQLSEHLRLKAPETEFERGLRLFGQMLIQITGILMSCILAIHLLLNDHTKTLDVFTFALALAVGMTPELLPAIFSITLARGAQRLAKEDVIVRRLSSIENLGSMSVLCSDKTGTLTDGVVRLYAALSADGQVSPETLLYAVLNAKLQTGFVNPIDQALASIELTKISDYHQFDEVPYDFIRKRLSVVVESSVNTHLMITKGAFTNVMDCCTLVALAKGIEPIATHTESLSERFETYSKEGYRVLGLAVRDVTEDPKIDKTDEIGMTFFGFLLFEDPAKPGAADAISQLRQLGVRTKVITGDNRLVAARLGVTLGIEKPILLTGTDLHQMSDAALIQRSLEVDIFAETEPNQKERILLALRKRGEVVGYLGDGINDASALHAADVGISVDSAVDVAKQAADIVLLKRDLGVIVRGVITGREAFANSIKYVLITTSANFGNMVSMAGASLLLPFLPLQPKQILLNNFLSDLPALAICTDRVDPEQIAYSHPWNLPQIKRFMLLFGTISSVFDYLTFAVLIWVLQASEAQFQTGWFVESLITELTIVIIIRTRRSWYRSYPSRLLAISTATLLVGAVILPYTPIGSLFGLVALPWWWIALLLGINIAYLVVNEKLKYLFYDRFEPVKDQPKSPNVA